MVSNYLIIFMIHWQTVDIKFNWEIIELVSAICSYTHTQ